MGKTRAESSGGRAARNLVVERSSYWQRFATLSSNWRYIYSRLRFMSSRSFLLQIHNQELEYLVQCSCKWRRDWLIIWKIINYSYITRDSLRRYVCMCLCSVSCLARWYELQKCYSCWLAYSVDDKATNCQAVLMIQLTVKQWFQYRKVNCTLRVNRCSWLHDAEKCLPLLPRHRLFCDRPGCSNYGMVPDRNTWLPRCCALGLAAICPTPVFQ